jgi:putative ABC transport system permease protein
VEALWNDVKYALRMLRRSPAFTIAASAALALGIGANTAIFSVVDAVLLRPVPFPDPDRIVFFMSTSPEGSGRGASPAKFAKFRRQTDVIQDASAFRTGVVNLTGGGVPEQLRSGQVSADFFRLTGAPIIRGRTFSADEDLPRGPHVALISEGLWKRRFGSAPDIVGKPISLGDDVYTIVGIVGSDYHPEDLGPVPRCTRRSSSIQTAATRDTISFPPAGSSPASRSNRRRRVSRSRHRNSGNNFREGRLRRKRASASSRCARRS